MDIDFVDGLTDEATLALAENDRVSVYRVNTETLDATKLDEYEINDGSVSDITIEGTKIYAAAGSQGLYVLGLDADSNGATLTKLGSTRFDNTFVLKVEKRDTDIFELATYADGVIMMKIEDPENLGDADSRQIGSSNDDDSDNNYVLSHYDTDGVTYSVKYGNYNSNNYSLIADGQNGLVILKDVTYELSLEKDYDWINFLNIITN